MTYKEPRRTMFAFTLAGTFSFYVFKFFIALYFVCFALCSIALIFFAYSGSLFVIDFISLIFWLSMLSIVAITFCIGMY